VVRGGRFLADVTKRTFAPREDLYILYAVYDEASADYGPVWLVPSMELAKLGADSRRGKAVRFATSLAGETNRWRRFRHRKEELPDAILAVIDQ
jgi:hypothetical protein